MCIPRHIENQEYHSENFSKKPLEGQQFSNCTFNNCNFTESLFSGTKFCSCRFNECNFSMVRLEGTRFQDVVFNGCKMVGVEFFKCEKSFFIVHFKNSLLHYCNFADLNLKGTVFLGSKLKECYFTNCCLIDANFAETDLSGTNFHNSDLSKADFSTATNYDIDPISNKIKKAKFSFPEAIGLLRGFDIRFE